MAERDRQHILLQGLASRERYRPPARNIPGRQFPSPENRSRHGRQLRAQLSATRDQGEARLSAEEVRIEGSIPGIHVVFESFPGIELALESLDLHVGRLHPELLSVREVIIEDEVVEQATVFVPEGRLGLFLQRIEQYIASSSEEKIRNRNLVDRIRSIGLASLEQLWTDSPTDFPRADDPVWWEVWLRRREGVTDRFRTFIAAVGGQVGDRVLGFRDRVVMLARTSAADLARAVDVLDDLAELRKPRGLAEMLSIEPPAEQAEWVEDLRSRTVPPPSECPAACILDTGVHQPHPLLAHSLVAEDCHACDPTWGTGDHSGHGTEMAGLALYGDLGFVAFSPAEVRLRHRLESVKFLPATGSNPPELWGAFTATAASLVEIEVPERRRVFSVATTAPAVGQSEGAPPRIVGQPSSWSAAIDALAAGLEIDVTETGLVFLGEAEQLSQRLFLLAAGNVRTWDDDHLARSDVEPIEDPGQAWNALTIGACTDLTTISTDEVGYDGWSPLAQPGDLSPHSRTSVAFDRSWPLKPDVVLEGGNVARSPDGTSYDTPYSFQRLTTKAPLHDARLFTVTCATSAATSQAAHLSASVMAELPDLWPETVRGLVVHSAQWTPAMQALFDRASGRQARIALRRRYGMGVPDLLRATKSATDALTLIIEDSIKPFDGEGRMREMHLHDLPWPGEVLADLGGAPVRLRVTLSYFIEPNPGSRGWVRRYSYASHGLRFDVRRATEAMDDFRMRVNQLALAEEQRQQPARSDASEWFFGPDYRVAGSLHTDIWNGTAAELANRSAIAIYPVSGWWKERPDRDRSERGARYALLVSIETPDQDVDIWTPVAEQVGIPTEVEL
jgi:hypothetical protein